MHNYDRTASGHQDQVRDLVTGVTQAVKGHSGGMGAFSKAVVQKVLSRDRNALNAVYHDMFDRNAFIRDLAKRLSETDVLTELASSLLEELENRK